MPQDKAQFACVDIRVIDEETQLYWLSSRYYSSELCRWISPDSANYLNPGSINGLNLYAYVNNNPIGRMISSLSSYTTNEINISYTGIPLPKWVGHVSTVLCFFLQSQVVLLLW